MDGWDNFFIATAAAAATLTGLVFVGVSISLGKILETPALPNRALSSLILLFNILIVSILLLVPNQSATALGLEILIIAVVVWLANLKLDVDSLRLKDKTYRRHYVMNLFLNQLAILPYLIAGLFFLLQYETCVYWIAPGIIFSFLKALMDAWVLLLEIHR